MAYTHPFLCMCESSEGSVKSACMLRLVWEFTERICRMYAPFVQGREQWMLWRDWTHSKAVWAMTDRICIYTLIYLCMCEGSECSGETERMLRLVQALTDRICHIYTRFVHVWEQWMRWRDCKHAKARLRIHRKNTSYVCPFCAYPRPVMALVGLHTWAGAS